MHRVFSRSAFSFTELLVAVSILSVVLAGMMEMFVLYSSLSETSSKTVLALTEIQNKIEELKSVDFSSIVTDYSDGGSVGNKFNLSTVAGKGVIVIEHDHDDLLKVTIRASFRLRNNRVIGEDANLNGTLDPGEDLNGNGVLDSPIFLVTYIAKR